MIINLHFIISFVFFAIGLCMRYGLWHKFVIFCHKAIPKLSKSEFDEYEVRRFLGETSIKLGAVIFLIPLVGIVQPESFKLAILVGWFCAFFLALASVTFIDKIDIFDKRNKAKQKAKIEKKKAAMDFHSEKLSDLASEERKSK